jgi:hypothetical protein
MTNQPKYPGIRITTDGNHLVSYLTEARYTEGGVFFPITSSTQMREAKCFWSPQNRHRSRG